MLYSLIAFCGHNNYGNRTVEKLDTLADYLEAFDIDKDYMQSDVNFITGDGVHTSITLGNATNPVLKDFDYLVVYNSDEIVSRWFVLDSSHNTYGQVTVQLQRDVVKDCYEELIDAPMFIEKAILPYDNPLIFNQENMTYNQIKTNEWSLRDRSKVAWIVGYFSRFDGQGSTTSISGMYTPDTTQYIAYAGGAQDFIDEIQSKHYLVGYEKFSLTIKESALNPAYWNASFSYYGTAGRCTYLGTSGSDYYFCGNANVTKARTYDGNGRLQSAYLDKPDFDWNLIETQIENIADLDSSANVNKFISMYNGQLIKTSENKIYRVSITQTTRRASIPLNVADENTLAIKDHIIISMRNTFGYNPTTGAGICYGNPWINHYLEFDVADYQCTLIDVSSETNVSYSIPSSRVKCLDQPYDMFVMPYINDNTKVRFTTNANQTWSDASDIDLEITKNIAQNIKVNTTTAEIYDIQILPYCPIPSMIEEMDDLELSDAEEVKRSLFRLETLQEHKDYEFIRNQQDIISIIFFPNLSSFTFDIDAPIMSLHRKTPMGRKVASETEMFRLCSPNYSGQFEWNIEKAGGCAYFNVDCTYLPHNPWIHVTPEFGLLYGKDYNDARGLVCSGDFSLAQMTSAWTQYQMQNKNYQQIFDRGIQNMETKRVWERTSEIAGAAAGTVAGIAAGAKLGGGVVGGIIGGIASAAAGAVDVMASEMLYNENKDYTQDMFGYNLGNIKALPQGLGRSSSFNANSKLFPFVEKYDCTDEEKEALRQKINYNGMTVNAIGKIRDYLFNQASPSYPHNYIKGRLIRLESEKIDNEYLAQLIQELEKGVYFN